MDPVPGLKPGAEMLHPYRVRGLDGLGDEDSPGWNPGLRRMTPSGSWEPQASFALAAEGCGG